MNLLAAADGAASGQDSLLLALSPGTTSVAGIDWIVPAIAARLETTSIERRSEWLGCLGQIRTRDSLRTLLRYLDAGQPNVVRDAALAGAIRLTGQYQLGTDARRWNEWFAGVEWLPEPEWQRTLADGLWAYNIHLESQREGVTKRLVESERRRFIDATVEADRWNLLAAQLKDELPIIRRLGIELTNRELANARLPAGPVPQAVLGLLSDPAPDVRTAGANLVERLSPAGAAPVIASILLTERDPAVLSSVLRLAARWPSPEIRDRLFEWLDPTSASFADAVRALDAIEREGMLSSSGDRQRALAAIRRVEILGASSSVLRLRCVLGDQTDQEAVASLLASDDPRSRLAAAGALASLPDWLDPVAHAAMKDEALIPIAAEMIRRHRASAAGLSLLLTLPVFADLPRGQIASGQTATREALTALTEAISPGALLSVGSGIQNPELREAVLARFATMPIGPVSLPVVRGDHAQSLIAGTGLLRLAQTRLELAKPGAALTALDRLEESGVPINTEALRSLRAQALLGVNRIADTIELDAPASSWIVALASIVELPHAPTVLRVLEANYAGQLSPAEADSLALLRKTIDQQHPEGETTGDDSQPAPRR